MISPMEASRRGIEADFASARNSYGDYRYSRLIAPGQALPTQFNRQVDVVDAPAIPAGGGGNTFPFQLSDATVTLGTPLLGILTGTMQDLVPTGGPGTSVSLGSAGTYNVYLDTTIDINGVVTACACSVTTGAMPANTSYDGYILLGTVVVSTVGSNLVITAINQFATHSLRCGIAGRQVVSGSLTVPGTFEFWGF